MHFRIACMEGWLLLSEKQAIKIFLSGSMFYLTMSFVKKNIKICDNYL